MESPLKIGNRTLISLTDAARLVPYSRDYIARLAREAKIAAAQIDRQWFIDRESLRNFYELTQLEVKARAEYTRALRRQELEAFERKKRYEELQQRRTETETRRVAQKSVIVIFLGLWVGFLLQTFTPYIQLSASVASQEALLIQSADTTWYEIGEVVVSTSTLSVDNGVLLLPQSANREVVADPAVLFSDPVTITNSTSSNRGEVTTSDGTSIPFVEIPVLRVATSSE